MDTVESGRWCGDDTLVRREEAGLNDKRGLDENRSARIKKELVILNGGRGCTGSGHLDRPGLWVKGEMCGGVLDGIYRGGRRGNRDDGDNEEGIYADAPWKTCWRAGGIDDCMGSTGDVAAELDWLICKSKAMRWVVVSVTNSAVCPDTVICDAVGLIPGS